MPMSSSAGKSKQKYHHYAQFLGVSDDASLTKSQLDHIILQNVGSSVNDEVLGSIFNECDADGSGEVTIKELYDYLGIIPDKVSHADRRSFVLRTLLFSRVFWPALLFAVGSFLGIVDNILGRTSYKLSVNLFGISLIFFTIGSYIFVALDYETVYKDIELHDRINAKIVTWVLNKDTASADEKLTADHQMTMVEFNQLLQSESIFLPCRTVEEIFDTMDEDHSGKLSLNEIKEYAIKHEAKGKISKASVHARAFSKCLCFRFGYWVSWGWTIANALSVVGAYINDPSVIPYMFRIGSILLALSALGMYHGMYYGAKDMVDNIHERIDSLEDLVKRYCQEKRETNIAANEVKGNDDSDFTEEEIEHAAERLFANFDSGEGDGKLDFLEFNDGLTRVGFVTALPVIKSIFDAADTSKDGSIDMKEFIVYILDHSRPETAQEYYQEIIWHMRRTWFFYIYGSQAIAGVLFTVTAFVKTGGNNWALPGSIIFLIGGCYFVYFVVNSVVHEYDVLAHSKIKFKQQFLTSYKAQTKHVDNGLASELSPLL